MANFPDLSNANITDLVYASGMFVASGERGFIYSSSDARTWTMRRGMTEISLYDVTFGNNRFVAAGAGGEIVESTDGETWTDLTSRLTTYTIRSIAYGNGISYLVLSPMPLLLLPSSLRLMASHGRLCLHCWSTNILNG